MLNCSAVLSNSGRQLLATVPPSWSPFQAAVERLFWLVNLSQPNELTGSTQACPPHPGTTLISQNIGSCVYQHSNSHGTYLPETRKISLVLQMNSRYGFSGWTSGSTAPKNCPAVLRRYATDTGPGVWSM